MKTPAFNLMSFLAGVLVLFVVEAHSQDSSALHRKIPIDPARWYQLTNVSRGLGQLFDADLNVSVNTGYGKIIADYESWYPLFNKESVIIDSILFFDGQGTNSIPMNLYVIDSLWNRTLVASFTGSQYNKWVGPYPERTNVFKLDKKITNIRYLLLRSGDGFPTEMEIYGYYQKTDTISALVKKQVKLSSYFGVNTYEWDFENGAVNPYVIDENRYNAVGNFSGIRHYMDWQKLENSPGSFTYSPTRSGGWNYDTIYQRCKAAGIEVLACLKTLPDWMLATYPDSLKDAENIPARHGAAIADPNSYADQARVAFQYAARYGSNTSVNPVLLSVNATPRWTGDKINTVRIGLGLIKYIECDNERDKWWKGRKAYQTGREYAANLSAFYDGHKNTMGPGVGVKNADTGIQVVMAGVALANTDYFRGMIDWCKEFRGYLANGAINLCWDIINYHLYTNDPVLKRGIAPEKHLAGTGADSLAMAFVNAAHQYAADMPVWVTEAGYDINDGSVNKAIAIGSKSVLQTQADWILRTALLYARNGIQKLFFYQLYDDAPNSGGLYATSGLINPDHTRRPAADFIYQTNKLFGNYIYQQTISTDPIDDQYVFGDTNSMHIVYVPDEKGRTSSYTIDLHGADSAIVYTPTAGADAMAGSRYKTLYGKITLTATETPVFVVGKGISAPLPTDTAVNYGRIKIYPNPATNILTIDGLQPSEKTELQIISSDGKVIKKITCYAAKYETSIAGIAAGVYYLQVLCGTDNQVMPFIKGK